MKIDQSDFKIEPERTVVQIGRSHGERRQHLVRYEIVGDAVDEPHDPQAVGGTADGLKRDGQLDPRGHPRTGIRAGSRAHSRGVAVVDGGPDSVGVVRARIEILGGDDDTRAERGIERHVDVRDEVVDRTVGAVPRHGNGFGGRANREFEQRVVGQPTGLHVGVGVARRESRAIDGGEVEMVQGLQVKVGQDVDDRGGVDEAAGVDIERALNVFEAYGGNPAVIGAAGMLAGF